MTSARRSRLYLELAFGWFGLPLVYLAMPEFRGAFFMLWPAACVAAFVLWRDPTFDRRQLWRTAGIGHEFVRMMPLFAVAALAMIAFLTLLDPDRLFALPRERPGLWLLIIVLYPLLSVYPQELIWRSFFFHRYGPLCSSTPVTVLMSALAFGWMHLILLNAIAVALTTIGGLFFAQRYARTRSLPAVSLEHALLGGLVFTIGLGKFFVVR